jgi:hypothetical protein
MIDRYINADCLTPVRDRATQYTMLDLVQRNLQTALFIIDLPQMIPEISLFILNKNPVASILANDIYMKISRIIESVLRLFFIRLQ